MPHNPNSLAVERLLVVDPEGVGVVVSAVSLLMAACLVEVVFLPQEALQAVRVPGLSGRVRT